MGTNYEDLVCSVHMWCTYEDVGSTLTYEDHGPIFVMIYTHNLSEYYTYAAYEGTQTRTIWTLLHAVKSPLNLAN